MYTATCEAEGVRRRAQMNCVMVHGGGRGGGTKWKERGRTKDTDLNSDIIVYKHMHKNMKCTTQLPHYHCVFQQSVQTRRGFSYLQDGSLILL